MSNQQIIVYREPSFPQFWGNKIVSNELRLTINRDDFVRCLNWLGVYKYYNNELMDDYMFVVVKDNIIKAVTLPQIKDEFYHLLRNYNDNDIFYKTESKNFTFKDLHKLLAENVEKVFNKALLEILPPIDNSKLLTIDEETNYFFFTDLVIKVTPNNIEIIEWRNLNGLVWDTHIIERRIGHMANALTYENIKRLAASSKNYFGDFIRKVMGDDDEKIKMLRSALGYLTHTFMEGAQKAIYLTDLTSTASTPNGRTGKTLIARAVAEVTGSRPLGRILDGKNFNEKDQFRWGTLQFGDRMVVLNDMDVTATAQHFFTAITEGIPVRKMQRLPFIIKPKLLFCNNKLLKGDGDSLTDRLVEIEMHPFFSPQRRPNQVYGEYFFGLDWDRDFNKWLMFYAYMIECSLINLALRKEGYDLGILYKQTKSLEEKRLLENIPEEFFEFMEEKVEQWRSQMGSKETAAISPHFVKADLSKEFSEDHNSKRYTISIKMLTRYLTFYCNYKNYKIVDAPRGADGKRKYQIVDVSSALFNGEATIETDTYTDKAPF
jgi:hypothetical protein